jgi:hypothetical protein
VDDTGMIAPEPVAPTVEAEVAEVSPPPVEFEVEPSPAAPVVPVDEAPVSPSEGDPSVAPLTDDLVTDPGPVEDYNPHAEADLDPSAAVDPLDDDRFDEG